MDFIVQAILLAVIVVALVLPPGFRFYWRILWEALKGTWGFLWFWGMVGAILLALVALITDQPWEDRKARAAVMESVETGLAPIGGIALAVFLFNLIRAPIRLYWREEEGGPTFEVELLPEQQYRSGLRNVKVHNVGETTRFYATVRLIAGKRELLPDSWRPKWQGSADNSSEIADGHDDLVELIYLDHFHGRKEARISREKGNVIFPTPTEFRNVHLSGGGQYEPIDIQLDVSSQDPARTVTRHFHIAHEDEKTIIREVDPDAMPKSA